MNVEQIRAFFEKKKDIPCPLTKELITSGYQQRKGGYIKYAKEYSKENPNERIEVDYSKAQPNQWWHLIRSWCDRSDSKLNFTRRIRCGELYFWMAEVSGVFTTAELIGLKERALSIAKSNTNDGIMPLRTAKSNPIIRDYCFDRIREAVEANN